MRIITFIAVLVLLRAVGVFMVPLAVEAQQAATMPRIGYLGAGSVSDPRALRNREAFRQGLRELGYAEGQNIAIEYRWAEGQYDRLPGLALTLVSLRVDVIVAPSTLAVRAAGKATRTIPIVTPIVVDPVATGLVASLARPGGNITGLADMSSDLSGKRLELLRSIVPGVSRIAVLSNPTDSSVGVKVRAMVDAAQAMGVRLQPVEVRSRADLEMAFKAAAESKAGALITVEDHLLLSHRVRIAKLAEETRLPTLYGNRDFVEVGGLISYGPNIDDMFRRAATYVDKILKGARPGDLPIEQPTKFELVVNLKAAKGLGLTIPQSVLLWADDVIP